jgi:UDP-2,3-diacylglucosamine pyrophosphatase LpxH
MATTPVQGAGQYGFKTKMTMKAQDRGIMKFKFLHILQLIALAWVSIQAARAAVPELKCRADGAFKILQISDTHFGPVRDDQGMALIERLLNTEKPDLVVVAGDCVYLTGKPDPGLADMKKAISYVASAMEEKKIPWAITFGNHDGESLAASGITKADMMRFYESYPCNINAGWNTSIHGVGNKNILIWDSTGQKPVFAVWLIDSNEYWPDPKNGYDWIHTDQVAWYYQTSKELEAKYGRKIPGLMFFHIPLQEFKEMAINRETIGERHEPESPSKINSGMFAAVLDRGDVKGIFCGHDHRNNYLGLWHGIQLGFDGVAGYGPYPDIPKDDIANGRARGGRLFLITESAPASYQTWIRFSDGTANWESLSENYTKEQLK